MPLDGKTWYDVTRRHRGMPIETDREVRSSVPRAWAPAEPHLFLVLEGDRPTAGGMRCSLHDVEEVVLGRGDARGASRGSTGRLDVSLPDRMVSSRHARLFRGPEGLTLQDCGSTNGTFVNGARVTDRLLSDGDVVDVGRTVLRVRLALATPEKTAPVSESESGDVPGLATLLPGLDAELALVRRVARSGVPMLLLGETGTGKEVVAQAIHATSGRPGKFVGVNCAALPSTLVESLLFGHVKGAFSGAVREELGFVRRAHEGTLFLDEIGDLPPAAQAVLLRVLQEGEVVPVGSTRPVPVDLRVIAATHQPVEVMAEQGSFRRDLLARLQGFTHRLWPLVSRREDIGVFLAQLLQRLAGERSPKIRFSSDAARALVCYEWPLNVRELGQALSLALALADDDQIEASHLPLTLTTPASRSPAMGEVPDSLSPEQVAARLELIAHLERCAGNVSAVARQVNKAPMQIYRWMQRLHIDPRAFR
jgi:DNA-binding NtrC family response regulator